MFSIKSRNTPSSILWFFLNLRYEYYLISPNLCLHNRNEHHWSDPETTKFYVWFLTHTNLYVPLFFVSCVYQYLETICVNVIYVWCWSWNIMCATEILVEEFIHTRSRHPRSCPTMTIMELYLLMFNHFPSVNQHGAFPALMFIIVTRGRVPPRPSCSFTCSCFMFRRVQGKERLPWCRDILGITNMEL